MKKYLIVLGLAFAAFPACAADQTITLSVPGMTCAACPITVKTALAKVSGVKKTAVRYDKREVLVTFDDVKTNASQLMEATKKAGYPSSVKAS
ncbi:mercury resistance system periplasmic binding protein MerP [Asticcacaulis sp.]|uniref:mercury resistance system periplasmic binding protein MerP n=1 Tax=Asticcacaulis sp. TaxID=1872648 RepID=UPI0031E1EF78